MPRRVPAWLGLFACALLLSAAVAHAEDDAEWEEVIRRLTEEVRQLPRRATARRELAVAHNNYAVNLAGRGDWQRATEHLAEAMQLEGDEQFRKNLASVYLSRAHVEYNEHQLEASRDSVKLALEANPELAGAYALLGELEYGLQRLKEAKAAWERALELDPTLGDVSQRLGQLHSELPVESKFERLSQAYFDVRHEDGVDRPLGIDVRSALLEARRLIGSDFAYWPKYKVVVLLYTGAGFRAVREHSPTWLAGQYDGKIRVPVPSGNMDIKHVKQVVFHEYTHALIQDLAQGRCPTWLNEGLAEYEGARANDQATRDRLAGAAAAEKLIPWAEIDERFRATEAVEDVSLAYQQAHSIARYLIERYGFWRIRRVMKALAEGASTEQALQDEFKLNITQLEARWRQWLPSYVGQRS